MVSDYLSVCPTHVSIANGVFHPTVTNGFVSLSRLLTPGRQGPYLFFFACLGGLKRYRKLHQPKVEFYLFLQIWSSLCIFYQWVALSCESPSWPCALPALMPIVRLFWAQPLAPPWVSPHPTTLPSCKLLALHSGRFCSVGARCQCLDTFLVVLPWGRATASVGGGQDR